MKVSKKAEEVASRFIDRIEKGVLKKRTAPNTSDDYPIDKAMENFTSFIDSEQFKPLISETSN